MATATWEVTGVLAPGGAQIRGPWPRSCGRSPHKRAAGEEKFGPQKGLSLKNQVPRSPERIGKEALSSRTPSADPGPTACCLLMHLLLLLPRLPYHLASSRAAVHSARTTALQPPNSWCDALIKVLAVRSPSS